VSVPASPEYIRQYENLRKRCREGKASAETCALLIKMEADIQGQGGPPAGMLIGDAKAAVAAGQSTGKFLIYALGAYLAVIAFRFMGKR
jgi:hypothetical protein